MIYQFELFRNLSFTERKTFVIHLVYSFIEGITLGVFALNEFVFSKSLQASNLKVGILFLSINLVLIFSIFFDEYLKRYKNKKKLLFWVSIVTRIPMLLFLLFPKNLGQLSSAPVWHVLFLLIFFIYFMAKPIVLPIINLYLKNNYKEKNFGKLFSYATMLNNVVMIVVTFSFGKLMDADYNWYRYIYPAIGLLSIFSVYLLAQMRLGTQEIISKSSFKQSIIRSLKNMRSILINNKAYRDFEIGFMLYGFAWMVSFAIIPIYWNKVLLLNNTSAAFYKNFYYLIAIITLPLFGRMIGKTDPRKFSILSFTFMFLTILFTALAEYFPIHLVLWDIRMYLFLILSNIFYGLFAGSMPIIWGVGSTYFCKTSEAASYQAIHLSMVGIRAGFSPLIGILLLDRFNYTVTFSSGMITLLIAILVMLWSVKNVKEVKL